MMRTAALRLGGLASTGALGGMAYIGLSDEQMAIDARRAVKIYGHFAPLVMEYRMLEAKYVFFFAFFNAISAEMGG